MNVSKREEGFVKFFGAIGGGVGLLIGSPSGFLFAGGTTTIGTMVGGVAGKGIYWVGDVFMTCAANANGGIKETRDMIEQGKKAASAFERTASSLCGSISIIKGAATSVVGGIAFKCVEYLGVEAKIENGQQIERAFEITSLAIVALGFSIIVIGALKGAH